MKRLAVRVGGLRDERAQGMVEYGLILALISIAAVVLLGTIGGQLADTFKSISGSLSSSL